MTHKDRQVTSLCPHKKRGAEKANRSDSLCRCAVTGQCLEQGATDHFFRTRGRTENRAGKTSKERNLRVKRHNRKERARSIEDADCAGVHVRRSRYTGAPKRPWLASFLPIIVPAFPSARPALFSFRPFPSIFALRSLLSHSCTLRLSVLDTHARLVLPAQRERADGFLRR